jgi:hypothetical protein
MVCDNLGIKPDADTEVDAPGNSFMCWMTALGNLVREKVRGVLHHGVKRALVVVRSGFEYDMGIVLMSSPLTRARLRRRTRRPVWG